MISLNQNQMETILQIKNLHKSFKDDRGKKSLPILSDIDFEIKHGEFLTLVGPSGSGKSTLIRIGAGLDTPSSGSVVWAPEIKPEDVSFVFQQFALLPWLSVFENVELAILDRVKDKQKRKEMVMAELETFGLEKFADAHIRDLSGGMRQRLGVARALVTNPKIIFMDEPFSELDSFTSENLRALLLKIWQERKMTIVMVTHIIEDAVELSDRIAVLAPAEKREGHHVGARLIKIFENKISRPRAKRSTEFFALEDEIADLLRN